MEVKHVDLWEKKLLLIWTIMLAGSSAVMLFLLLTGEASLNFTLVIFMIVIKFLAGFGTVIGISSVIIFVLTKFEDKFKGEENKKRLKALLVFMLLVLVVLVVYEGPVKIIESVIKHGDADNIFDKLLFVYGIVSLMYSLYIRPIWKGDFLAVTVTTTSDQIKTGLKTATRGIKKKFFIWRKNYAKAELQEQQQMQDFLKKLRQQLAVIVLPFLGAGTVVFTVICAIFIFAWLRIFVVAKERKPNKPEIILLACACIGISAIAIMLPFFFDATPLYTTIREGYFGTYISQFAGLFIASIIYLRKMLAPIIAKRKVEQIKDLKAEKEELKKEHENLLKEHKKLKKTVGKENKP